MRHFHGSEGFNVDLGYDAVMVYNSRPTFAKTMWRLNQQHQKQQLADNRTIWIFTHSETKCWVLQIWNNKAQKIEWFYLGIQQANKILFLLILEYMPLEVMSSLAGFLFNYSPFIVFTATITSVAFPFFCSK